MRSKTEDQGKVLGLALFSTGIFYILIGLSTSAVPITLAAFCFFLTLPFVNTSLDVLFRQSIHPELQGRVWSLISLVSQLGMLIALGISGVLAKQVFNPLLTENGNLADSLGRFIGTGTARGSGLLVILCGGLLSLYAVFVATGARTPSVSSDLSALAR